MADISISKMALADACIADASGASSSSRFRQDWLLIEQAKQLQTDGKYSQAEKLYRRRLADEKAKYRTDKSSSQLDALNESRQQLSGVLFAQKDFIEAEELLRQSMKDLETQQNGKISNEDVRKLLGDFLVLENEKDKLDETDKKFAKYANKAKLEIQKYGTDPETFMVSAIQQNRLLAIGEDHVYDGTSQHHRFGSKLMPLLKQKGATHLALEFPSNHQDILDRFMDTGKLDLSLLESSKGSNEFLASKGFCESKDLISILESARKSGLKLIAVDDADSINQGAFSAIFGASRDKAIAKNLAGVLNADKKNKVVFWAGAIHAQVTADKRDSERASQILRNQGVNVLSVLPKDYETMSDNEPVRELFREVSRPVLVPMMKAKEFSKLPELKTIYPGQQNFNAWDAVILYPPAK